MARRPPISVGNSEFGKATNLCERDALPLAWWICSIIWLVGFSGWFFSFAWPLNPSGHRWTALVLAPYDILDLFDPPAIAGTLPWSWRNLNQRIPFFLIALMIWVGSWGIGSSFLRRLKAEFAGAERLFFACGIGVSIVSLTTLANGLFCGLSRWLLIVVLVLPTLVEGFVIGRTLLARSRDLAWSTATIDLGLRSSTVSRWGWIVLACVSPFVIGSMLGAMSPQTDFDVIEYHLGGPKEWFQQGHIVRLPHNVYTSFPFLSEMLILSGMVLYGDWQWGALAGQAAIAGFAPLTAVGIYAFGSRWISKTAGWIGALVYLTAPWTYRISIIAYAEGSLACYLLATLTMTLHYRESVNELTTDPRKSQLFVFLTGFLAGSAMACKYTGLLSVVIPAGLLVVWQTAFSGGMNRLRRIFLTTALFSLGVITTIGPWMLKNTAETGNPVYPLAVRIFGGTGRTKELDFKWRQGHAAKTYATWRDRCADLPVKITDVLANNNWHSPLMFGLAPLSLIWLWRRRNSISLDRPDVFEPNGPMGITWLCVAWQFATWWLFTHHIDRFYVPMFSVVAILAGAGACWRQTISKQSLGNGLSLIWTLTAAVIFVCSLLYNVELMLQPGISGFNSGRLDLKGARDLATSPRLRWLNDEFESGRLPANTRVLFVGEADLFHARFPYYYNTVFDECLLEQLCAEPDSGNGQLRSKEQILSRLRESGITHVAVNWSEILRYRNPNSYGYTDFVHPERFAELQRLGLLGEPLPLPPEASLAPLSDEQRTLLLKWNSKQNWLKLITEVGKSPAYTSGQIFPVLHFIP